MEQDLKKESVCQMCREFCPSNQYVGFGVCSSALDYADREDAIVQAHTRACEEFILGTYAEYYSTECFESKTTRAFNKEVAKYLSKF